MNEISRKATSSGQAKWKGRAVDNVVPREVEDNLVEGEIRHDYSQLVTLERFPMEEAVVGTSIQ